MAQSYWLILRQFKWTCVRRGIKMSSGDYMLTVGGARSSDFLPENANTAADGGTGSQGCRRWRSKGFLGRQRARWGLSQCCGSYGARG